MSEEILPLSRTACYEEHVSLGGNLVDFHGFELPIWYSNITKEHLATRNCAGLFDVSHMGLFRFSGNNVISWLESLATQKVSEISDGSCAYTHFLDEKGQIIDDMIFAITSDEEIHATSFTSWQNSGSNVVLGVPNASMINTMWEHFQAHIPDDGSVVIENLSDEISILALQGPSSLIILSKVLGEKNVVSRFKCQAIQPNNNEITGWIQGTGYTGEKGVEIMIPNSQAITLWKLLLEKGAQHGIVPVCLGARDTLRLEKGYLLSGQDFLWPALGTVENLPEGFLARTSWETNVPFGLNYLEKGPMPRPGKLISKSRDGDIQIGIITSGGPSPCLENRGIGMGYIEGVKENDIVYIIASSKKCVEAVIVKPPFV